MKIYFLIGIMILTIATVGFGATLNSSPSIQRIGGSDNIIVSSPSANITSIVLNTSGNNITSATITVKNIDSVSHTYKVCVIIQDNTSISDTPGTAADCANTSSISASATGSVGINFTIQLNKGNVNNLNMSIQQII